MDEQLQFGMHVIAMITSLSKCHWFCVKMKTTAEKQINGFKMPTLD